MSIEDKLDKLADAVQNNTLALVALTEVWSALRAQAANVKTQVDEGVGTLADVKAGGKALAKAQDKAEKPPKEETKAEAKVEAEKPAKPDPAPEKAKAEDAPRPADTEIARSNLSQAVSKAAVRNRQGLIDLLASRGIKRATELPEGEWASFTAEVEAL